MGYNHISCCDATILYIIHVLCIICRHILRKEKARLKEQIYKTDSDVPASKLWFLHGSYRGNR